MPRIIGIDIPAKKKLKVSLTYIYGIGPALSKNIMERLHLNPESRASELTEEELGQLNSLLQSEFVVEGDLRRRVQSDIKRLIAIHSYRGQRHRLSLPVRGQRTKTNSRTRKGKRKTVAGKKK
ncbi:30S ribosomal protein S13 [Candidatus Chlamydia sanziniae]|uniref:Small ribosomal subunit protein uS13 n=1 Tax=Candidatus Chlamydia sanziniae TaxID=1806891 RepID=A0A1A9HTW1_9CHLA|nr:30S ribosomal protein S13 [Candidatus Chlamydia sanziniae]ANH78429.1 SSU ribosomal protein S13p [Candidatus Chlamydia sanziniae]